MSLDWIIQSIVDINQYKYIYFILLRIFCAIIFTHTAIHSTRIFIIIQYGQGTTERDKPCLHHRKTFVYFVYIQTERALNKTIFRLYIVNIHVTYNIWTVNVHTI